MGAMALGTDQRVRDEPGDRSPSRPVRDRLLSSVRHVPRTLGRARDRLTEIGTGWRVRALATLGARAARRARTAWTTRGLWLPRAVRAGGVVAVAVAGGWVGAALTPTTTAGLGPLTLDVRVMPTLFSGVRVMLPPAGRVDFDTHETPVGVKVSVSSVDLEGAKKAIDTPGGLFVLSRNAPDELRRAVIEAALKTSGCAVVGSVLLSLLVYRRSWRRTGQVSLTVSGGLVLVTTLTTVTFDADRFAQPNFTGLLSRAPYVAGSTTGLVDRLESYRSGLEDIVRGVTALSATSEDLPFLPAGGSEEVVTVLHVSDIHLNPLAYDLIDQLVGGFGVDLVVDTGDHTTWGTGVESRTVRRVGRVGVPYVFVRGNHDSPGTEEAIADNRNAVVLDGTVTTVEGLVISGDGDPVFTPDQPENAVTPPAVTPSAATSSGVPPGRRPASSRRCPRSSVGAPGPAGTGTGGPVTTAAPGGSAGPEHEEAARAAPQDPQVRAGKELSGVVWEWNVTHPDHPVDLVAVHDPAMARQLVGSVPLVLAGHTHNRNVTTDHTGTMIMVQGSTGGAGITARGLERLRDGQPLPLTATLVHIARSGERKGTVVGYDEVTVGGFGLASVSLQRHVVRSDQAGPVPRAGETPTPTTTPMATTVITTTTMATALTTTMATAPTTTMATGP